MEPEKIRSGKAQDEWGRGGSSVHGAERPPEGCLAVAIRVPVRIVVLVLVVPVRMVWDALAVAARLAHRTVLRPAGRALALLWHVLAVVPVVWLYGRVLTPLGHGAAWLSRVVGTGLAAGLAAAARGVGALARGLGAGLWWLVGVLVVPPAGWLHRRVLTPVGHGIVRVLRGLGAGCGRLVRVLAVVPAGWLYRGVLTPLGRAIAWSARVIGTGLARLAEGLGAVLTWLALLVFVWPWAGLWRYVLMPAGRALGRLGHILLVVPAVGLLRWVLAPLGRALAVVAHEIGAALGHAWRIAGQLSLAAGRLLGRLLRRIFVEPVRWAYRSVCTPLGHLVRDLVLRPAARAAREAGHAAREALAAAREGARHARADIRRMLFGAPAQARPAPGAVPRREPGADAARTLGSSTTALTKD